jgi:hypothetical protein
VSRRLAVLIAATIVLAMPAGATSQFSDVPDGHPLQKPIEVLAGQEIMPGLTPTLFGGTNFLNRYTMADILNALIGAEYVPFRVVVYSDVPSGHPSLPAINRVTTLSLMSVDKGAFKGKEMVSRYELAQYLDKLLQFRSAQAPVRRPHPVAFKDVPGSSPYNLAVERVVNAWQLTPGYPDGTFRGNKPITRFEAVELVAKAAALLDPRVRDAMEFNQAATPTPASTAVPTAAPTAEPTAAPTAPPTPIATPEPTPLPTPMPTATPFEWPSPSVPPPTPEPTPRPTARPTVYPTARPTVRPTVRPTIRPTTRPTAVPTSVWTPEPTPRPTPTPIPTSGPPVVVHQPGEQVPWFLPTPSPAAPAAGTPTPAPTGGTMSEPGHTGTPTASGGIRSPFEGYVALFGAFGAVGENIAINMTPSQPGVQPTPLPNPPQPDDVAYGQGATTPNFGIMGQYWYGNFGGAWDLSTGSNYVVVNNQNPPQGIGQFTEDFNGRLQLLYKFPLLPGMEVAAGLEGAVRSTSYFSPQGSVTVAPGYFQVPRTYSGAGAAARFGYRVLDSLSLDAGISALYLLMQAGQPGTAYAGSWDRFGTNIHVLGRYDIWRSPFGPLIAIGGYQGHIGAAMQGDGLETVHMLRLGLGLTFAPAP